MKQFFFTILYQPLYNFLIFLVWLIPGHSMALAIIALTIIIRLILLPSSLKAAHLQVKNMVIQPKVKRIQREIKDKQEQSKALMQLYKEEGVSPFGSCLPLLIQLPILIVLYQVFRGGLSTNNFGDLYSFIPRPETINTMFLGIDLAIADPWILPIIAGVSQLILSWLMMPPKQPKVEGDEPDPAAMMTKQMVFLLPITTVFFGRAMPAALVVYWIITTLFSIGQQIYVNKKIKREAAEVVAKIEKRPVEEMLALEGETAPAKTVDVPKPAKESMMTKIMNKRLDKAEKKAGVSVTVRTKKK